MRVCASQFSLFSYLYLAVRTHGRHNVRNFQCKYIRTLHAFARDSWLEINAEVQVDSRREKVEKF